MPSTHFSVKFGGLIVFGASLLLLAAAETRSVVGAPQTVADFTWTQSISRSFTVNNAVVEDTFPYTEAISASMTVENRTTVKVAIKEAISRGLTVENTTTQKVVPTEAISRSYTVNNATTRKLVPTEAISRSSTVLNHPELQLEPAVDGATRVVYARCGEELRYQILGTLSEHNNRGLALVEFDVRYDGGSLPPIDTPTGLLSCDNPMVNFVGPAGITEPTGFGGKLSSAEGPQCGYSNGIPGGLTRVGGAQNTFGNHASQANFARLINCFGGPGRSPTPTPPLTVDECLASFDRDRDGDVDLFDVRGVLLDPVKLPAGSLLAGVAQPDGCGAAIVAEGTLVVPSTPGEHHLWIENAIANAVAQDATGNPFWRTRPAVVNASSQLAINVVATRCDSSDFEYFQFADCFSGPGKVPEPPPPYMTTKECLGAFDDDQDGDVDLRDWADAQVAFRPRPCISQAIVSSSSPAECAIDARQPTNPNGLNPYGFSSITLNMRCPAAGLTPSAFAVSTAPSGSAPMILTVTPSGRDATLQLSGPISPGRWTCFTHTASNTKACIGFLPGDVDRNGIVAAQDETLLQSCLAGSPCPIELCDINRDGVCNDADVIRLENLFYGDFQYDFGLGRSLPVCPSGP
jgi:hypothetical protein